MQQSRPLSRAAGWLEMTLEWLGNGYGHHHPNSQEEAVEAFGDGGDIQVPAKMSHRKKIHRLASDWGMTPMAAIKSPRLAPEPHWQDIVRGMVREAPLPSLMVAVLVGVLVARR